MTDREAFEHIFGTRNNHHTTSVWDAAWKGWKFAIEEGRAMSEHHVKAAAKLYEIRDHCRRLLGDKYKAHMAELGKIIKATAELDKRGILETATDFCNKRHLAGMDALLIISAAVELVEPSP